MKPGSWSSKFTSARALAFSFIAAITFISTSPSSAEDINQRIELEGDGVLIVQAPARWARLATELGEVVREAHHEYRELLGDLPALKTTLRLVDDEAFYAATGAPRWTNAMYYRREVIIPLNNQTVQDKADIVRSVRHEYTHAIVNGASGGHCPGWLDEGLAQWAEGHENPALPAALVKWLNKSPPVPLDLLQGGFTRLNADMVPAAYAQSLFAAHTVINTFGFDKIQRYFEYLRLGVGKSEAFRLTFGVADRAFEGALGRTLHDWASERAQSRDARQPLELTNSSQPNRFDIRARLIDTSH